MYIRKSHPQRKLHEDKRLTLFSFTILWYIKALKIYCVFTVFRCLQFQTDNVSLWKSGENLLKCFCTSTKKREQGFLSFSLSAKLKNDSRTIIGRLPNHEII